MTQLSNASGWRAKFPPASSLGNCAVVSGWWNPPAVGLVCARRSFDRPAGRQADQFAPPHRCAAALGGQAYELPYAVERQRVDVGEVERDLNDVGCEPDPERFERSNPPSRARKRRAIERASPRIGGIQVDVERDEQRPSPDAIAPALTCGASP